MLNRRSAGGSIVPVSNLTERIFARAEALDLRDALPRLAGLSAERVEAIGTGDAYTADEYEQLCRALAVDASIMYRAEETRPNRLPARFRAAMVVSRPRGVDLRILALAVEQGRILAHLLASLGRQVELSKHRQLRAPQGVWNTWREGYDLGEKARASLHPQPGPIRDVESVLRELGVHVARVAFSTPEIDAASIWQPDAVPIILLNKASGRYDHPGAVRATLAHELCHLLHDAGEQNLTTQVSWGTEGTGNYSDTLEIRARAFAPAFLAPRGEVRAWFTEQRSRIRSDPRATVRAIGRHWGLSFEGAAWHAKNCEVVEAAVAESLASTSAGEWVDLDDFAAMPAWVPPAMMHPDLPEQAAELWNGNATEIVLAALDEGHITVGRARELLTWS
jgi:Zn-dependent peptidase ImmA (M78 family)